MISGGLRTKSITKQSQEGIPLITVVTVVRNGEKTLEETILSVINQTYTNIEYIIIDGASTDDTLDIIRKYEDRIDYWISEPDKGIFDAMNKGIDLATGEWINFMNSGDGFYNEDTIMTIIPYMLEKEFVIYGNTQSFVNTGSNIIKPPETIPNPMKAMFFCHQSSFTRTFLMKRYHFNTVYKMVADFDFFTFVRNNYGEFRYAPIIIAKFDGQTGFSKESPLQSLREIYTINGFFVFRIKYLLFIFIALGLLIKECLKKLIPRLLLKKCRDWKYK